MTDLNLEELLRREAWKKEGACYDDDVPNRIFFPPRGDPAVEGKVVCLRCPVRIQCLEYAIEHGIRYGIWGGMTIRERDRYRRSRGERPPSLRMRGGTGVAARRTSSGIWCDDHGFFGWDELEVRSAPGWLLWICPEGGGVLGRDKRGVS